MIFFITLLIKVDVTDPCLFPGAKKNWKAFVAELVDKKRATTKHHEEVDPKTLLKIYQLVMAAKDVIECRGSSDYEEKLKKIPAQYHNRVHYVVQWGAELILMMYEVRRGVENLDSLEATDFQVFDDDIYNFQYIRWK